MKHLFKQSLFSLLFCCFFFSCSKEDQLTGVAPATDNSNVVDPCTTCDYQDLIKTAGKKNSTVGTVAICQNETELTITFAVSGSRENAWFSQTGLVIYGEAPTSLNPSKLTERESNHGDKLRTVTYTIPLADLLTNGLPGTTIYIAAYAVVPGQDGSGGMIWAGNLLTPAGNPNPRYFSYIIKECITPEAPTEGCLFTQGYFFAKPDGSQWAVSSIMFAGQTYNYSEARAIFFGDNKKTGKTAAKQAFLQALALELSLAGGATTCNTEVDAALADIKTYFTAIPTKVTDKNINTATFNKASSGEITLARLVEAAGQISACLNTHACNSITPEDLVTGL